MITFEIMGENFGEHIVEKPKYDVTINLIVAVGKNLKIGLNGDIPWLKNKTEAVVADLVKFRELTSTGVVVVGRNTWPTVKAIDYTNDRLFLIDGANTVINHQEEPWSFEVPQKIALSREKKYGFKPVVWIAGGAKTYTKWLKARDEFGYPIIDNIFISFMDYDGEADTYFEYSPNDISGKIEVIVDYNNYKKG